MVPKRRTIRDLPTALHRDADDTATRYNEANPSGDCNPTSSPTFIESPPSSVPSHVNGTAWRRNGASSTPAGSTPMSSTSISMQRRRPPSRRDGSLAPTVEAGMPPPAPRRSVPEAMDLYAVIPIDLRIGARRPGGTKRSAAVAAPIDEAPNEDRGGDSEPGARRPTPVGRRTTRAAFRSSLELRPPRRHRVGDNLETAEVVPEELWVAVGEDRCKPCKLVGREVCKPQWSASKPCRNCVFCAGMSWSCKPPDSWLKKVATILHAKQARQKTYEVATDDAPIEVGISSGTAEVAPPTTEVEVVKRRSGHQRGRKVTQATSGHEDFDIHADIHASIDRLFAKVSEIKRIMENVTVMCQALCIHHGITPSLLPGFKDVSASTLSMVPSPVIESPAHSLIPQFAGANSNAGSEHEELSQEVQEIRTATQASDDRHLTARVVALEDRFEEVDRRLKDAGL